MKLKDQVCTLEQARRLKELGVIQKSLLYHHPAFDKPVFGETWVTRTGTQYSKVLVCNDKKGAASAFTVAELGTMLPNAFNTIQVTSDDGRSNIWRGYDDEDKDCPMDKEYATEAEARATMLAYLIENELITAEEVNVRLKG